MLTSYKIFQNLHGTWSFARKIDNHKVSALSGIVTGTAHFSAITEYQLHYAESGIFTTATGAELAVKQEYSYAYSPQSQEITKYFCREQQNTGLFYELKFNGANGVNGGTPIGEHLCVRDHYSAQYDFGSKLDFSEFTLTYKVQGPDKDYITKTTYARLSLR